MKFAAPYVINSPIEHDNIDEYNITFTNNNSEEELFNFIEQCDKRVNVKFETIPDIAMLKILNKLTDNLYVRVTLGQIPALVPQLKENSFKFFFDETIPIFSNLTLHWAIKQGPTDIYIMDDLLYNLPNVFKYCELNNVKIRMVLNKIPSIGKFTLNDITAFVPRPQDYDLLSLYISTGEFNCYNEDGSKYNWSDAKVLYKHWYILHSWTEDLRWLNRDIKMLYPNHQILPELNEYKIKCRHRCTDGVENICSQCDMSYFMAMRARDEKIKFSS